MEAKGYTLAILGDQGVGKTSFCNRYISKSFNQDEKPTVGAEYFQKIFFDNNMTIKVDIFGSSGNPKCQKIAKYLYKDARSIIIMFNLNKKSTFDNLNFYLENIRNNSVEDPIIYIVGNFSDEASGKREITKEAIKEFETANNLKYFEISCSRGIGIEELMKELTKEILLTEKYFTSNIDKDISDIAIQDTGEKDMEKISKNLKTFYKETKEKKNTFVRCTNCHNLLSVKFKNTYNEISFVCHNCKIESNLSLDKLDEYLEKLSEKVVCYECLKTKEDKIKLEYCNKCRHYVCPSCKKNIIKTLRAEGSDIHKLVPYYLMDILCYDHYLKILGYCKSCQKSLCIKCFEYHKTHENLFYEDFLDKLKEEHKEEIKKEIANLNKFIQNYEDCISNIRKEVEKFIYSKKREIKLKEQILLQLNNIQFNQHLIETLRNAKYMKAKKYDMKAPWNKKLTDIFEVIGQPIQIKNINIIRNHVNYITPHIVPIKSLFEEQEENKDVIQKSYGLFMDKSKEITDFCSMNDDKYIGICFNDGNLELYEDMVKNKEPIHTYEIFQDEGIKSIYKSIRNINNFFFCGKNKIINIEFFDGYKNKRTILEINDNNKIFQFVLEQNNLIISCDTSNKIILYDKSCNQIGDITNCIESKGKKDIYSMKEVMNNIFYITFNKTSDLGNLSTQGRSSYFFNEVEEANIDIPTGRSSIKNQSEIGTKVIELDENTLSIKKEHILSEKQEIIGAINERLVLIRDDNFNSIILFDAKMFKNVQRFYFELTEKPIFCSILNKRNNLIDFVLVSDQMKMLQNIFDEEHKNVTQISGLKIKASKDEMDKEISKEGKIIHMPFKGFIKYIGDNNFVVINY